MLKILGVFLLVLAATAAVLAACFRALIVVLEEVDDW